MIIKYWRIRVDGGVSMNPFTVSWSKDYPDSGNSGTEESGFSDMGR